MGVMTAAVLPLIAGASPNVVSGSGPLFNPTIPALIVSVGVFQLGWILILLLSCQLATLVATRKVVIQGG